MIAVGAGARTGRMLAYPFTGPLHVMHRGGHLVGLIMVSMITAVLFDLDGTIFDRDGSLPRYLEAQHARVPSLSGIPLAEYVCRFQELDKHGHGGTLSVYSRILDEWNIDGVSAEDLNNDFHYGNGHLAVPFIGLHAMLDSLSSSGFRLGMVTNGDANHQAATIEALGMAPRFGSIVISGVEGVRKPEAEIFQRALRRLDAKPENAVFVGDHPTVDIGGARAVGMFAIWKKTDYWTAPVQMDGAIESLSELSDLISGLGR